MYSVMMWCAATAAVLAAIGKLIHSRRSLTPAVHYLCVSILLVGLAASISTPATLAWLSRYEPFPNTGRLLADVLAMCAALCGQGLLVHVVHETEAARRSFRRRSAVLVLAVATLMILLGNARIPFDPDLTATYSHLPAVTAYVAVFAGYIAWATLTFIVAIDRYINRSNRPRLRVGLRIIQAAGVCGIGWAILEIVTVLITFAGGAPAGWLPPLIAACASASVFLIAAGAIVPVWGRVFSRLRRLFLEYRDFRALRPLWLELSEAVPQVRLAFAPGRWAALRDPAFARYRRMIEIRDVYLVLRPYFPPHVAEYVRAAADTDSGRLPYLIEAATLAGALEAKRAERRFDDPPESLGGPEADPDSEARWLRRVARQFTASPIVAEIRLRVREELQSARQ